MWIWGSNPGELHKHHASKLHYPLYFIFKKKSPSSFLKCLGHFIHWELYIYLQWIDTCYGLSLRCAPHRFMIWRLMYSFSVCCFRDCENVCRLNPASRNGLLGVYLWKFLAWSLVLAALWFLVHRCVNTHCHLAYTSCQELQPPHHAFPVVEWTEILLKSRDQTFAALSCFCEVLLLQCYRNHRYNPFCLEMKWGSVSCRCKEYLWKEIVTGQV